MTWASFRLNGVDIHIPTFPSRSSDNFLGTSKCGFFIKCFGDRFCKILKIYALSYHRNEFADERIWWQLDQPYDN